MHWNSGCLLYLLLHLFSRCLLLNLVLHSFSRHLLLNLLLHLFLRHFFIFCIMCSQDIFSLSSASFIIKMSSSSSSTSFVLKLPLLAGCSSVNRLHCVLFTVTYGICVSHPDAYSCNPVIISSFPARADLKK